ncbi:putative aaa family atpase [Rhypophila sp. PSN 637]
MSALQNTGASSNLEERLKLLEETIARLENRAVYAATKHDSIADREPGGGPRTEDTIPQVRRCNFMQFKNRFTNEDGRYAIDVLVSGALLEQEMHEEMQFRQRRSDNSAAITHSRSAKSKDSTLKHQNLANAEALEKAQSHDVWIQRVRLQSPAILKTLSKVQGESWSLRPRTYMRPFLTIISFQPEMRKELQGLEGRWASQLDGIATSPMATVTSPSHTDQEMDNISADAPFDDCPEALATMRCYVKFVDEEIMPQYTQFEDLKASDDPKIRFSDVHYLFRTGELVYRPYGSDTAGKGDPREWKRTGKRLWRSYGIRSRDTGYRVRPSDHRKYDVMQPEDGQEPTADEAFLIKAFYLEYTGEEFCTVTTQFAIQPFTGLRRIRSLPVYPLRFGPEDVTKYMADAIELGDKTLEHINHGHVLYDGWTVTRTPKGEPVHDANAMELKNSEYVHSDAMVDFNEAFQACPHWKPKRTILRPEPVDQLVESDDFPILWWSGPDRAKLKAESSEVVPVRTGVSTWEQNKFVSTDPLLFKMSENLLKDKALVACRVFAYVFQDRKWAQLDAKNLIQRSVKGHLLQKADERRYGQGSGGSSQDFIRGKGAGLFILLHGMPGVGKTTTAEAIAQFYGKPLFKITCGDFGLSPEQIETNLSAVFRLADSWDCILLIDEVDTFFSQRTKGDGAVAKNALVSVFLRILDYYTGILFMTTNRVGALDEAFRSRIHYSVLYPLLSAQQALDIWKINLDRLRTIDAEHQHKAGRKPMEIDSDQIIRFAERHLFHDRKREKATQWWNGRQIRNIFQVARSLAYADAAAEADRLRAIGSTKTPPPPRLKLKYFDMMDQVTVEFEDYLKEVYCGQTASDLAKETEHRCHRTPVRSPQGGKSQSNDGKALSG